MSSSGDGTLRYLWRLAVALPTTSPFYFAARSPMLYIISKGDVPTYSGGQDEIVYLVTSTEKVASGTPPLRVHGIGNAALGLARYGDDLQVLDDYLDWELMAGTDVV